MKILYVIDSLKIGGAEVLLLSMLRAYSQRGHDLRVAYFTHGPLYDDVKSLGVPLYSLSRSGFGLKDPRVLPHLLRLIRQWRPDVVHTHLFKSDFSGQIAARLASVPVRVSTLHSVNAWRKNRCYSMVMRRVTMNCNRIIAVSEEVRNYTIQWSHYPPEDIVVIENGIDLDRFDPDAAAPLDKVALWRLAPDAPTVGVVGRLQPIKGHHLLLQAAMLVVREMPQVQFILIGDGPLRVELEIERTRLGLLENVVFAGIVRDIPGALMALDVIAFSSLWEGLPVALLEAMAMRRPVVAAAVGGIPGALTDGENGLLVPPQDPQALATGLLRVLRDPAFAARLGEAALETVKRRYSAEIMHRRILDVYTSVLAQGSQDTSF